jgi:hypothetical protein
MEPILILAAFSFMLVLAASGHSRRMTTTTVVVGAPQGQSRGLLADMVAFLMIVGFVWLII